MKKVKGKECVEKEERERERERESLDKCEAGGKDETSVQSTLVLFPQ